MSESPAANVARSEEGPFAASPSPDQQPQIDDTNNDAPLLQRVRALVADKSEKKRCRLLYALLVEALLTDKRLTRFDAERHGCHVSNTSVSQNGADGIVVSREPIELAGRFGIVHCKAYWISRDQRRIAPRLLEVQP